MSGRTRSQAPLMTAEDLFSYKHVQTILEKIAEAQRLHPNMSWNDPSFQEGLLNLFDKMSELEKVAYMFTFGAPKFNIYHRMFSLNQKPPSVWWDSDDEESLDTPNILLDYLKYNVTEKYSVSFQNDEMTDKDVEDRYYKPFFETEGPNILDYYKTEPYSERINRYYTRKEEEENSKKSVEREYVRNVVGSILKDDFIEEAVTRDLVIFLNEKDRSVVPCSKDDPHRGLLSFRIWGTDKYHTYGRHVLAAMGVDSKPFLVMGVGPQSREDDILGITVLADVKPAEDDFRETFDKLKEFLDVRDEQFMKMVSTKLYSGNAPQIGAQTRNHEVMMKAVDLYATITNLTSAAVQAGVPRVLLMNSVDYLAIELDKNLNLEPAIYTDGCFPNLVKCEYKWFNREDHFLRLFFCSYIVPTLAYKSTVDKFRKHVSEAASAPIEDLLQSVTEALHLPGPNTRSKTTTAFGAELMYPESFRDQKGEDTSYALRDDALKFPFYAKISEAVLEGTYNHRGAHSQVILVDPKKFLQYIPKCFIFNGAEGVERAILKIYDPLWSNRDRYVDTEGSIERYGPSSYKLWRNEITIYERLCPLMGSVVPNVYSYGYVVDVSLKVGRAYRRYTGPYILMEQIKWGPRDYDPILAADEASKKILPGLKKIHELGIIHNDIKWGNFAVTEDNRAMIYDFSHSVFSDNKFAQSEESGDVYWTLL